MASNGTGSPWYSEPEGEVAGKPVSIDDQALTSDGIELLERGSSRHSLGRDLNEEKVCSTTVRGAIILQVGARSLVLNILRYY